MATTRIIPLHINKGKSIADCLRLRTDYIKNPDKTEGGSLVSCFQCCRDLVDLEFLATRSSYEKKTGRAYTDGDIIAYQVRQSFAPGEVDAATANSIGMQLAQRLLKGKHAFIVATHTDKRHIQQLECKGTN